MGRGGEIIFHFVRLSVPGGRGGVVGLTKVDFCGLLTGNDSEGQVREIRIYNGPGERPSLAPVLYVLRDALLVPRKGTRREEAPLWKDMEAGGRRLRV